MKCFRASPYGRSYCQLEKGHEGACFDDTHHFTENIDGLGRSIILDLNQLLKLNIPITEETTRKVAEIVSEYTDELIDGTDYGYCPDCDERMPDEPSYNEGYL